MDKRDYLIKTFSRTKRKDYENYILTAIWHKLNNLDIKPVSQQYIKRKNGSHALMDLYFPQLYLGIEVDEAYHKGNYEVDKLRMDDIIAAIDEESVIGFNCLRIDATQPIVEINKRVDEIVEIINKKAMDTSLVWNTYEEELAELKQKEYLSIHDNISFKYIRDIANVMFNRNVDDMQRSYFLVGENMWAWCPHLSIILDNEVKSVAAGWLNVLAKDWSYIDESHQDIDVVKERQSSYKHEIESGQKRVVFAKFKNNLGFNRYRFVGVFKSSGLSPDDGNSIRYERIENQVKIIKNDRKQ